MDTTIVIGTIIFIIFWLIASIVIMMIANKSVNDPKLKSEYRGMSFSLTFLGAFCMWLMWVSVYMHQKNPLIQPIMKETVPSL